MNFIVRYNVDNGLTVTWRMPNGMLLDRAPLRIRIRGSHTFRVWHAKDSGEGPPVWADPGFNLTCFGPGTEDSTGSCSVETIESKDGVQSFLAKYTSARANCTIVLSQHEREFRIGISVSNPQGPSGKSLPLGSVELMIDDIAVGRNGTYLGSHAYGGWTHHSGKISGISGDGVAFVHGCIGLGMPVAYLHDPDESRGIEMEFMLNDRPTAWLQKGSQPETVLWRVAWSTERLLEPGQVHSFGGDAKLSSFTGRAIDAMRAWRDNAAGRYGLIPHKAPDWMRKGNIIEFNMNPDAGHGFTRLDDPKCKDLLERWRSLGYSVIHAVSPNHVGQNWLSPLDYAPREEVGGIAGERQALDWAHELGFHIYLWVTTVGIDRDAPKVKNHPEWFTHRPNGDLFYAWNSDPPDFISYAPDGDPLSTGWRNWLKEQVRFIIERGYDGIYVDGLTPRASNHSRYDWPGQGRNSVEDLLRDLAEFVRALRPGLVTFIEDESLATQATGEVTQGRYHPTNPYFKKFRWYHGPGGDPEIDAQEKRRIPPELVREYLLVRHASLLPGVVSNDILEGYFSEEARPWTVQSLLSGVVPKTHSEYIEHPEKFMHADSDDVPAPTEAERSPEHRLKGHREFISLLKFCVEEPLIREAPLSIEGVAVDGDDAVIGMLRPGRGRAILALIQFAPRPASIIVRLSKPGDVPHIFRGQAGNPQEHIWKVREIMRSMIDDPETAAIRLSGSQTMEIRIAPYGFRVFELLELP